MNDSKVELDPSLIETTLRARIHKAIKIDDVADGDNFIRSCTLVVRLDTRDDDTLLAYISPRANLAAHNIASIDDYIQANTELQRNTLSFSRAYKDHQIRMTIGKDTIAAFSDCELTSFDYSVTNNFFSFHILAKNITGDGVAKMIDNKPNLMAIEIKRAKHWASQATIFEHDEPKGDADTQVDIETANKIERAKDKANKANNAKVAKG